MKEHEIHFNRSEVLGDSLSIDLFIICAEYLGDTSASCLVRKDLEKVSNQLKTAQTFLI